MGWVQIPGYAGCGGVNDACFRGLGKEKMVFSFFLLGMKLEVVVYKIVETGECWVETEMRWLENGENVCGFPGSQENVTSVR